MTDKGKLVAPDQCAVEGTAVWRGTKAAALEVLEAPRRDSPGYHLDVGGSL